jgi:hypothetical protein
MLARETNCCDHVRDIGAARNRPWPAVYHSVIKFARSIVALIIRLNQLAAQTFSQCLETIVAEHRRSSSGSIRYCDPTQITEERISSKSLPLKETPKIMTAFLV